MNDLCSGCGKPPHAGGCKLGPLTDEERARHEAAPKYIPMCNRGPDPAYKPVDKEEIRDHEVVGSEWKESDPLDADKGFLYIGGLHPAMADLLRECVKIQATKGRDYTEGSSDRLNNFREAAEEIGLSMETVWSIYFFKHWKAVRSWLKYGQVESEPISGRIADCINYLLLLHLIVREKDPNQD